MISFPIVTGLLLWLFDKYRTLPILFFSAGFILIFSYAETESWGIFDWLKRIFILVPALILSISQYYSTKNNSMPQWTNNLFASLGFINISIFVIADVIIHHYANTFFGLTLLITYPFAFTYDKNGVVGFNDKFWVMMFIICDMIFIQFHPAIANSYYFTMMILPVEIIMLVILKDWQKAFAFRFYSLAPFLIMDTCFDHISELAYLPIFHPEIRDNPTLQIFSSGLALILGTWTLIRKFKQKPHRLS